MNTAQRKLILGLSIFLGILLAIATGIIAYAAHVNQTARFGDIFDQVAAGHARAWVIPALVVIAGFSLVGIFLSVGLFVFRTKGTAHASPSLPKERA